MARPKKNNADYFSHDAGMRNHIKMKAVRRKFGIEGYAIWCMILEHLTSSDFFIGSYSELDLELMSGDFEVEPSKLKEILEYFAALELLVVNDNEFYSESLNNRFEPLLTKRERDRNGVSANDNPHSKVKESKSKNIKSKEITKEKSKVDNRLLSETEISDVSEDLKSYLKIAKEFQALFIKNLKSKNAPTKTVEKAKLKAYLDPIRLSFENDGVTEKQFQDAYKYLNSREGDFWKSQIQSTKKLRDKLPTLISQYYSPQKSKQDVTANFNNGDRAGRQDQVQEFLNRSTQGSAYYDEESDTDSTIQKEAASN